MLRFFRKCQAILSPRLGDCLPPPLRGDFFVKAFPTLPPPYWTQLYVMMVIARNSHYPTNYEIRNVCMLKLSLFI